MELREFIEIVLGHTNSRTWFNHDRDLFANSIFRGNVLLSSLGGDIDDRFFDSCLSQLDSLIEEKGINFVPYRLMEELRKKGNSFYLPKALAHDENACPEKCDVNKDNCHNYPWLNCEGLGSLCRTFLVPEAVRASVGAAIPSWKTSWAEWLKKTGIHNCCNGKGYVWGAFLEEVSSNCFDRDAKPDYVKLLQQLGLHSEFDAIFFQYPNSCSSHRLAKPTFIEGTYQYFRVYPNSEKGRTASLSTGQSCIEEIVHSCHGYHHFEPDSYEILGYDSRLGIPNDELFQQAMIETLRPFGTDVLDYFQTDW